MRCSIIISCLLLILIQGQARELKNPDQPLKGKWSFAPQKVWETDIAGEDILVNIGDIRIDDQARVFVLDSRVNKVHVFGSNGKFLFSFAKRGAGPGEIKQAWGMFLYGNRVLIVDINKIHHFSKEGKYLESIPTPGMIKPYIFMGYHKVLATPVSSMIVGKEQYDVVLYNLKTDEKKVMFQIPRVRAFRYSDINTKLILPMPPIVREELILVKNLSGVWYGYGNSYKINRLNIDDNDLSAFTIESRKREQMSPHDKSKLFGKTVKSNSSLTEMPKKAIDAVSSQIPDDMPYFHHIFSDRSGLFYVMAASVKYPHLRNVDIFSPAGKYLYKGSLSFEPDSELVQITMSDKYMVVFIEDSEGEKKLVRYNLRIPQNK